MCRETEIRKRINSFNKYVFSASYVPCTVLSHKFTAVTKTDKNSLCQNVFQASGQERWQIETYRKVSGVVNGKGGGRTGGQRPGQGEVLISHDKVLEFSL